MHINNNHGCLGADTLDSAFCCGKRTINRRHVHTANCIDNTYYGTRFCAVKSAATARDTDGKIDGTEHALFLIKPFKACLAGECMVSKCYDIYASGEQLSLYRSRNTASGSGILSICDHEVDTEVLSQLGKLLTNQITTSLTDNISEKENSHSIGFPVVDIGLVYQLNPKHC